VLDRDQILRALARLAEILRDRGTQGEICLLGGSVMVLAFNARPATKDVDGIFEPVETIRGAAATVQAELGLPDGWLNDAAKGYLSAHHEVEAGDLPQFDGLRIVAPTAEYMLAMKCMASRIAYADADPGDVADIRFLLAHLHIQTPDDALAIIERFYPADRVPPRARYLIESILTEESR
jgi:hypothetical protein